MSEQHERIDRMIREFDGQGWHRTGTDVDRRSAEWLAEQVRAAGLVPELEPFRLSRVAPRLCSIDIDGTGAGATGSTIEGMPQFDGGFTGPDGVSGRIGPLDADVEIGLAEMAPNGAAAGALGDARRAGRHRAIVAVTRGGRPGLAPSNAWTFTEPFGPPVLQVSSEAAESLEAAVAKGATVHVTVQAEREDAEALNVVARLSGRRPDAAPLVVMTPRSGWWECASERGGGLACFLEAARAASAAPVERDVLFVASSGHELGHLGLEGFIERRPALPVEALAWFHFGANIGAARGPGGRLAASHDGLEQLVLAALFEHGAPGVTTAPRGWVPGGEAHNIHIRGGRYASLVGSNQLFHLQCDRWPDAVDVLAIARYATAFANLIARLARDEVRVAQE